MGLKFWNKEPVQQELRMEPVLGEETPAAAPAGAAQQAPERPAAQLEEPDVPILDPQPPARKPRRAARNAERAAAQLPAEELGEEDDPAHMVRVRARRRLIGAVVLLVLVVALIPWILGHESPGQEERISVTINSSAPKAAGPAVIPTGVAPAAAPAARPAAQQPSQPVQPAAPAAAPAPAPAPAAAPAAPAAAEPARPAEAKKPAARKPEADDPIIAALSSSRETVVEASRPEAKKPEAKKPEAKKPEAQKPDPKDARKAARGRYSVQAAAFSAQKTARSKAAELTRAGIPAAVDSIRTSSGGTLWRVRTGPFATPEAAAAARARMQKMGYQPAAVQEQ